MRKHNDFGEEAIETRRGKFLNSDLEGKQMILAVILLP